MAATVSDEADHGWDRQKVKTKECLTFDDIFTFSESFCSTSVYSFLSAICVMVLNDSGYNSLHRRYLATFHFK
jgi:hypothetical protein